jgi:hypothetical protein
LLAIGLARGPVVLVGIDAAPSSANVQSTVELRDSVRPFALDGVPKVSESAMPRAIRDLASWPVREY